MNLRSRIGYRPHPAVRRCSWHGRRKSGNSYRRRARGSFAIRLDGISKSFANAGEPLEVLKNINLTVAEQAIVALSVPPAPARAPCSILFRPSSSPTADRSVSAARPVMSSTTGVPSATCSRMTGCCRGAPRFAMSNLPWRQAHCPRRNVLDVRMKCLSSSIFVVSKRRSPISFPVACGAV